MDNTQVSKQVPKVRVVAKKLAKKPANDRQQRNEKNRRLQQLVFKKYALGAKKGGNLPAGDSLEIEEQFRKLAVFPRKHPNHADIALHTVLQVAKGCYTFAAHDFDKMDLYEHMEYILNDAREKGLLRAKASETLVTRDLILTAQHRKTSAAKDYRAFVAKQSALANLPAHLEAVFKTCKHCGDRFRFQPPPPAVQRYGYHYPQEPEPWVHHGECRHHPGKQVFVL